MDKEAGDSGAGAGGGTNSLWTHSMLLQQGDQLPPGARVVTVTELQQLRMAVSSSETLVQQRVTALSGDTLQRLLVSGQTKPVVHSVLASPPREEQHEIRISLPQELQHAYSRPQLARAGSFPEGVHKLEVGGLQDRLVGVPTMGRVIQMSELNRLAIPELKIVMQCDSKLEDLEGLELPISPAHSLPLSSYMGKHTASLQEIHLEKQGSMEELLLPLPQLAPEPAIIELVGQSVPHNLPTLPPPLPVSHGGPLNRVADRTFPALLAEELVAQYRTASRYDAVWKCQDGRYKVHRLVLAACSPFLAEVLAQHPEVEGVRPVICTPDLSSPCVRAILCLFYTGKVNFAKDIMAEVMATLKMLGFPGNRSVTVLPSQEMVKQEIVPQLLVGPDDCQEIDQEGPAANGGVKQEEAVNIDSDDPDWMVDTAFDPELQAEDSDDDWWEAENKRELKKRKLPQTRMERYSEEDEESKSYSGFKRGRKSLKTPDTHEMFRTRGAGKGERSYQLALDLFEGKHVDFIYVCHACYAIFDTFKKLALHKDDAHPDNPEKYGPHHTSSVQQYNCPKCSQVIRVKHIAWFCKHLRYCRDNNDIANALVGPDEDDSDTEENGKRKYNKMTGSYDGSVMFMKDSDERLRITGEGKGRNVQNACKILVGRLVDYLWGCKICYSICLTEEELEKHKQVTHGKEEKIGKYWNASTENYTCPYCDQVQNNRHVVWFIYHMKKCNMTNTPLIKKEINEEEDTEDEEEMEGDEDDPEQIVLRTLNIRSERSEWMSEALFGKLVERIFTCHVCYSIFETAEELRQHYKPAHNDLPNRVINGPYYDAQKQAFNCPVCEKDICKKHNNSIFFIYHLRKCGGHTYPVNKPCQDCGKEFSLFPNFKVHANSHKALRSFMCHVCTKVFPSNARLNYHVQYVHSAFKPYACDKCEKAYKRKAELLEHEEMSHSIHFNYSCDKCGKQFYGKKNLALHMKTHYSEDEKKHVCTVCGYRFAKIKFLKNHMTTHSDIRQYACEVIYQLNNNNQTFYSQICGARVKTKDTLKQHRKKLHNLLTPVPKTAEVEEQAGTPGVVVEEQRLDTDGVTTITSTGFLEARVINTL